MAEGRAVNITFYTDLSGRDSCIAKPTFSGCSPVVLDCFVLQPPTTACGLCFESGLVIRRGSCPDRISLKGCPRRLILWLKLGQMRRRCRAHRDCFSTRKGAGQLVTSFFLDSCLSLVHFLVIAAYVRQFYRENLF